MPAGGEESAASHMTEPWTSLLGLWPCRHTVPMASQSHWDWPLQAHRPHGLSEPLGLWPCRHTVPMACQSRWDWPCRHTIPMACQSRWPQGPGGNEGSLLL